MASRAEVVNLAPIRQEPALRPDVLGVDAQPPGAGEVLEADPGRCCDPSGDAPPGDVGSHGSAFEPDLPVAVRCRRPLPDPAGAKLRQQIGGRAGLDAGEEALLDRRLHA